MDYAVHGRDLMTGIPKEITVSYAEIAHALDKSISKIEEAILKALEMTPPELSADIYRTGIYLTGGGALLRGLDKRIAMKTKLPVHVAEDPLFTAQLNPAFEKSGAGFFIANYFYICISQKTKS